MNVTFAGFAGERRAWLGPDGRNEEGVANLAGLPEASSPARTSASPTPSSTRRSTGSRDQSFAGNPVPLHKVGDTEHGIVVRGARILATLAPFADEIAVYPGHPLAADATDAYALSFSIPMDTPGLIFLCRDSASTPESRPVRPAAVGPLRRAGRVRDLRRRRGARATGVFIDGDHDVYNSVMGPTAWWPNIMQQTTIRALTKLEFAYGLAVADGRGRQRRRRRGTLEMLGELLGYVEITRSARAAGRGARLRLGRGRLVPRRPAAAPDAGHPGHLVPAGERDPHHHRQPQPAGHAEPGHARRRPPAAAHRRVPPRRQRRRRRGPRPRCTGWRGTSSARTWAPATTCTSATTWRRPRPTARWATSSTPTARARTRWSSRCWRPDGHEPVGARSGAGAAPVRHDRPRHHRGPRRTRPS